MSGNPSDPLKDLADVFRPDSRQAVFTKTLESSHDDLFSINLHAGVPIEVQQLFETAKNVSLYSWFVYRFHQVAELTGFSALEFALRVRARGTPVGKRRRTLGPLLEHARREGWLSNEAFPIRREMGIERARQRKSMEAIRAAGDDGPGYVEVPDPTAAEIALATASVDVVAILVEMTPKLRNNLAHGSKALSPSSRWTLRFLGEAINQLFPEAAPADRPAEHVAPCP